MAKTTRLPALLSRRNPNFHKNHFGHALIIAGSPSMLGAAALTSLAAMRAGAGLVTAAVPRDCNLTLQKKISHVVMTRPLAQSNAGQVVLKAFVQLNKDWGKYDAVAIGPGLGQLGSAQMFARKVIETCPKPLVVDADALNALVNHLKVLNNAKGLRILTPHPGEMARLIGAAVDDIDSHRREVVLSFSRQFNCIMVLKGHRTVMASPEGQVVINTTGNVGMATAGSGDVLTGMITSFLAQGMNAFDAARWGVYYHGRAGDLAVQAKSKISLIATDIIDFLPQALK